MTTGMDFDSSWDNYNKIEECVICGNKYGILLCKDCEFSLCKNCLGINHTYEEELLTVEDIHYDDCKILNKMDKEEKERIIKWCVYCKDGYEPEIGDILCNICEIVLCKYCIGSKKHKEELLHYSNCKYIVNEKKNK